MEALDMKEKDRMAGQGGKRSLYSRWVIHGDLILDSAGHIGTSSTDSQTDMILLRDEITGRPLLPGTSLAGVLRNHLSDVIAGYKREEPNLVRFIFGTDDIEQSGGSAGRSHVIAYDSVGELPEGHAVELRDCIRVNPKTATVAEHAKFEIEVLPSGTRFPVRLDFTVPNASSEDQILSGILTLALGLENGEIRIGARTNRGLGQCHVEKWDVQRYDLTSKEGWKEWMLSEHERKADKLKYNSIFQALSEYVSKESLEQPDDNRRRIILDMDLELEGGILIGGTGHTPDSPDIIHISSGGESIVPGSSIAGVLRSRALKILNTLANESNEANRFLDNIFGSSAETEEETLIASKLLVSEPMLSGGQRLRPTRVAIDRFTGGAMDGALFEEEVYYGGSFELSIELRNPEPPEVGLLLLLAKDTITGDLPFGATSSVGRGFVTGQVRVSALGEDLSKYEGTMSVEESTIDTKAANEAVNELKESLMG
jgi:CRISPR/Cas system CSM-associated protein Csm3 (group 7 of RAMP superfamily)